MLYSADKAEGETGEGNKQDLRLIDLTSSESGLEFRSGFVCRVIRKLSLFQSLSQLLRYMEIPSMWLGLAAHGTGHIHGLPQDTRDEGPQGMQEYLKCRWGPLPPLDPDHDLDSIWDRAG